MRATVCDLHLSLCALRSLATEEATVAFSNPVPPLLGLGAHCDQWAAIFLGKSDDARKGVPAYARPRVHISARWSHGAHANVDTSASLGVVIEDILARNAGVMGQLDACRRILPSNPPAGTRGKGPIG